MMYSTIATKNLSREQWLHLRKSGIGGSDAGAICGLIKKPFGKKKLKELRTEQIQNLYNSLNKSGYSRNTVELVSVVLSGMYKQAYKNQLIQRNPVPLATLPKMEQPKERRVLTQTEQKIFMKAIKGHPYELILSTGFRSGEVRGLR